MSIQTLLPRDTLLRQFAICFDDDEVPFNYRVEPGKVRERNSGTLKDSFIRNDISWHLDNAREYMAGKPVSMSNFDCNHVSWKIISKILHDEILGEDYFMDHELAKDLLPTSDMVSTRVGYWVPELEKQMIRDTYDEQLPIYHRFMSMATYLEDLRDKFTSVNNDKLAIWKKEGCLGLYSPPDPYSKSKHMKYYQVGTIVILKIRYGRKNQDKSFHTYVLTNTHYSRIIDYVKSCALMSLFLPDIAGLDPSIGSFLKLLRFQSKIALKTPNGVGSVFKTARQILFLRGDSSNIMGSNASCLFISGLSGVKEEYGEQAADFLYDCTSDRRSALNLANLFRIVPHPDAEMSDVFDSIKGFTDPNKVEDKYYPKFLGYVRKTMFLSLSAQRFDVRADPIDPRDSSVTSLVEKINSTSTPIAEISKTGYHPWANLEFREVRGLFDHDTQDIPVSNKSSAPNCNMSKEEIKGVGSFSKLSDYKLVRKKLKAINDVVSTIAGKDELSFVPARARFRNVIKCHEEFEKKYLDEGIKIDDIPSEDLADFVISNRDASYTVLTEPKLGEVHKEVTRLFYMAEQALKIMTQVTERSIKKVISKAAGVSIVKSYRARRKEIEEMLDAYSGISYIEEDDGEVSVVYISFDMSEFSKKFPQKLVRAIGEVLSELTGEDWMSRIDVFFRAAVVYHNSRGFMGSQSGAKGGFEGFLNFIWTLAMKVVMDIATEASGVEGVLAVYSDDGLLRLYISGLKSEIAKKIRILKKVFARYGLIFHLDKTAVSREIMEYLGMYGDRGMLIPTWVKEVMSLGKRKQTPGLETVYDKIRLWDAQCGAIIKASGPHYPAMLSRSLLSVQTLRRLNRIVSPRILNLLTIIPSSAGGFRVSSISESSLLSSIEGFSEFAADLELLSKSDPVSSNAIAVSIYENLKREKDAERSILTGSFLQTTLPDTSGLRLAVDLVENSSADSGITKNPLTKERLESILGELRNAQNFSQRLIRELISSIPEMIKYNKSLALVKSSAALKFVSRDEIRRSQKKDTRSCMRSISWWEQSITEFDGRSGKFDSNSFMAMVGRKLYPSYDFSPFKDSPRVALIPCKADPDIIVNFEITENAKITEQVYIEPKYKGLGAQLSPEIAAETTFNTERRMVERFINSAARLVSTNTSLVNLYYIVANAFDLPCPTLARLNAIGSHKSSKSFGMEEVHTIIPAPYHALVNSYIGHSLYNYLRGRDKKDRTTLTEAARIAGYLRSNEKVREKVRLKEGSTTYIYNLRNREKNSSNPEFQSYTSPKDELVDDRTTKMFTDLMIEERAQANMLESVVSTNGLVQTIKDTPIVKAILLTRLTKWMRSTLSGLDLPKSIPFNIPDPWTKELIIESAVSISFVESAPNVRRAVQLAMNSYLIETRGWPSRNISTDGILRAKLNICINKKPNAFDRLNEKFVNIIRSVSALGLDERMRDDISRLNITSNLAMIGLISFLKRKSVTGGDETPSVVINTNTFADTKMSREVKNSVKNVIDSALCSFIGKASEENEESFEYDHMINYLNLLKNMLRPSGHRNMPFNKHMMMIQVIKMELFINEMIEDGVDEVTLDDLQDYRLEALVQMAIRSRNSVIDGRSNLTSGEDMREELSNKGVHPCMFSRINYILKELAYSENESKRYRPGYITRNNILDDETSLMTILNDVVENYNVAIRASVTNLEIRHSREADIVTNLTTLTPVEEVGLISANTTTIELIGLELDISNYYNNATYNDLITNLLMTHQIRWGVSGYTAYRGDGFNEYNDTTINNILGSRGILGPTVLRMGDGKNSPLRPYTVQDEFYFHSTSYDNEEHAVHNYLYINRLHGGMAVIGKDMDKYMLLGIVPKNTKLRNTLSAAVPLYVESYNDTPTIYKLEIASQNLSRVSRELGMRPNINNELSELASVMIRQTYQRYIGSSNNPENDDHFLVAMAELARGAWSNEVGMKVLAMFTAWMTCEGEVSKEYFLEVSQNLFQYYRDGRLRVNISFSMSACWEWVRMMKISAGPDIDTEKVSKIIRFVGIRGPRGGMPSTLVNLPPRSLVSLKQIRGQYTCEFFFGSAQSVLYEAPDLLEDYHDGDYYYDAEDYFEDLDDGW